METLLIPINTLIKRTIKGIMEDPIGGLTTLKGVGVPRPTIIKVTEEVQCLEIQPDSLTNKGPIGEEMQMINRDPKDLNKG